MVLAAVVLVLAIIGPFTTFENLTFSTRLVYWGLMATVCYFVGFGFSVFAGFAILKTGVSELTARFLGGLLSGLPVAVIVWSINRFVYGFVMEKNLGFLSLLFYVLAISTAISMISYFMELEIRKLTHTDGAQTAQEQVSIAFLKRLPPDLGKTIISLEAQDHYVNVTTTKGSTLVLIRLSDAIDELEGLEGLRIHRSYWVAQSAITGTTRKNGKLMITLTNDKTLPVSRTYAANVKAALLEQ